MKVKRKKLLLLSAVLLLAVVAAVILLVNLCGKEAKDDSLYLFDPSGCELFAVQDENGLWGYVNKDFKTAVNFQYVEAKPFTASTSLAPVRNVDGKWGYINTSGDTVIDFKFESAEIFNVSGYAVVSTEDGFGIVDSKGNTVIEPKYMNVRFSGAEGVYVCTTKDYKSGLLDVKGNTILEFDSYYVYGFSESGYSYVSLQTGTASFDYGVIDKNGDFVIEPSGEIEMFSEKLNSVMVPFSDGNGLYGFRNLEGGEDIEPVYTRLSEFYSNGLAFVREAGGSPTPWRLINTKGEYVSNHSFKAYKAFSNGLAAVCGENDLWGFVNEKGELVCDYKYNNRGACEFDENGLVRVISAEGLKFGVVDKNGREIVEPKYSSVEISDLCVLAKSERENEPTVSDYTVFDHKGKELFSFSGYGYIFGGTGGRYVYHMVKDGDSVTRKIYTTDGKTAATFGPEVDKIITLTSEGYAIVATNEGYRLYSVTKSEYVTLPSGTDILSALMYRSYVDLLDSKDIFN